MRSAPLLLVALVVSLTGPSVAHAERGRDPLPKPGDPRLDNLVGRPWEGLLEQSSGGITENAKLQLKVEIRMKLQANDEVWGTGSYALTLDKKMYKATFNVRGKLLRSSNSVALQFRYTGGDNLPTGLVWCEREEGTFTFFKDKNVSTGFILRGQNENKCTGNATFELTTTL